MDKARTGLDLKIFSRTLQTLFYGGFLNDSAVEMSLENGKLMFW